MALRPKTASRDLSTRLSPNGDEGIQAAGTESEQGYQVHRLPGGGGLRL
jgi:hypothetical protein